MGAVCGNPTPATVIASPIMQKFPVTPIRMLVRRPAVLFLVSSIVIGILTVAVNPPLRGPDETAHFLRALGLARGDLVPSTTDARGRRGLFLTEEFYEQFSSFNEARETPPSGHRSYTDIFRSYLDAQPTAAREPAPVFVPYEGSEGYSPVPYLPYIAAAKLAAALDLKFLAMLYFMRISGLLAAAAITAYAIALTPSLKWMFFSRPCCRPRFISARSSVPMGRC